MKKIYFVNGFLEAGKTTFIKQLLSQEYFNTGEKTLLLLCEEGEVEYEESFCREHNIILRILESEDEFTEEAIQKIENEVLPERIIVEFNGMWKANHIIEHWDDKFFMEIAVINAQNFELYLNNLKPYMVQQVRTAYMTVFRSCDGLEKKLAWYRRSIRAVNPQTNFVFKNKMGEMNPRLDEDLPYDINKDYLNLTDENFGVFYIDAMENVKRYVGKTVFFTGYVFRKKPDMMLIGRKAMTCCSEDLTTFAFICDIADKEKNECSDWVRLEGRIKEEYFERLQANIPVIDIIWMENCLEPEQTMINVN